MYICNYVHMYIYVCMYLPLQHPQRGQSYAAPHQPPHDARFPSRFPPPPTGYPAATGYGSPVSMMPQPSQPSSIRQPQYQPSSMGLSQPISHPQGYQSMGVSQGPLYSLKQTGYQP